MRKISRSPISRRFALAFLALAMLAFAPRAMANAELSTIIEEEAKVTSELVTPHTDWGVPYALGKTRVLFFTAFTEYVHEYTCGRDVVELNQRFDLDAQMLVYYTCSYSPVTKQWRDDGTRLADLINQHWDAYVFLDGMTPDYLLSTNGVYDYKTPVMNAVNAGAGLVLVGTEYPNVLTSANLIAPVPAWLDPADAAYTVGQGRGALLPVTPTNITYRLGWEADYDQWQQRMGKAILWAAHKEPQVTLTVTPISANVSRSALPTGEVTVAWNVPNGFAIPCLELTLRRGDGQSQSLPALIPATRTGSAAVQIPLVRADKYSLDVIARSARGIENFGTAGFTVTGTRQVTALTLGQDWGEVGQTLSGTVACAGTVSGPDERLIVSLLDRRGRELKRQDLGQVASQGNFSFLIEDWMPMLVTVEARLVSTSTAADISSAWAFANVTKRHRDCYNFMMWGYPKGATAPYAQESLAKNGVTVNLSDFYKSANLEVCNPPKYVAAYDCSWAPNDTRIYGYDHTDSNGDPWPSMPWTNTNGVDWNDETNIQAKVNAVVQAHLPARRHGVFVYSLGDECQVHGSTTSAWDLVAYRNYLQQEYGNIQSLNASWSTNYGSFSDVQVNDNRESSSYEKGNYPRWFDRQAWRCANFCKLNKRFGDAFRAIDPQALSGVEGSAMGSYGFEVDLDNILRSSGFVNLYTGCAEEVVRSLAPRDFRRSTWLGSFSLSTSAAQTQCGTTLSSLLNEFWKQVTLGNDSIWWWCLNGIGYYPGFMAPNYDLYSPTKEALNDTRIVREGLVDLLKKSSDAQDDGVGILYSYPSICITRSKITPFAAYFQHPFINSLPSPQTTYTGAEMLRCADGFQWRSALREFGLYYRYFSDRQLRLGEVQLNRFKAVILPCAQALGTNEVQALRNYVNNGGTLIADVRVGLFDGHCKPLAAGSLDDVFGVTRTANMDSTNANGTFSGNLGGLALNVTVANIAIDRGIAANGAQVYGHAGATPLLLVHSYGSGKAILLNFWKYPALSDGSTPAADVIKAVLNAANVKPAFTLLNAASQRLRNTEVTRWWNGQTEIFSVFRHSGTSETATIVFTNSAYLYDIKNHQSLGACSSFNLNLTPCRAQFFARSPQILPAPVVSVQTPIMAPGAVAQAMVSAPVANGQQAVKVRVTLPNGQAADWLDKVIVTSNNGVIVKLPIALNDSCGVWTITATELFTQLAGTVNFTVTNSVSQTPAAIAVTPPSASVVVGGTRQFTAAAYDQFWKALSEQPAFNWAVSGGGSINPASGLFTAATAGTNMVTASSGGKTGTAYVVVTVTPSVAAIAVTPPSASVVVGGTRQFTATASDQFGCVFSPQPAFTWTVSGGGTINPSSGLFTAGAAGGPYTVTAASAGRSGTATVYVTLTGYPGLVGWWKFDEINGIWAADSSGYANNAVKVNYPAWVAGKVGNAVLLEAVNEQVLGVDDDPSFNYANGVTISTWLKINSLVPAGIWSDHSGDGKNGVMVYIVGGNIMFSVGDANGANVNYAAVQTGQWYHVVCTYDNSAMKMYINGALKASSSCSRIITDNTATKLIGKIPWGPYYLDGCLDDLRVYNRALSSNEVANLAQLTQVSQTITFNALPGKTYGDAPWVAPFTLSATASSGLPIWYVSDNPSVATIYGSNLTIVGAGSATITAIQTGDENYTQAANVIRTLTVAKKGLTVKANDKSRLVGQANPAFDAIFTGLVGSDTPSSIGLTVSFACSADASSVAGSYPITPSGAAATANYAVNYQPGTLTVKTMPVITWATPAQITYGTALGAAQLNATAGGVAGTLVYTPASGTILNAGNGQNLSVTFTPSNTVNYATATKSVAINVLKKALTVTANAKSKDYGAALPALTCTAVGLVNGDQLSGALATPATAASPVGSYPITQGTLAASANYTLSYTGANLTVNKGGQTITNFTPTNGSSFVTTNLVTLTATASSGLAVTNFTVMTGPGFIVNLTNMTFTNSGEVKVTARQDGNANWSAATPVTNTFTVSKATTTVTLGNLNQKYDGSPKPVTATTDPSGLNVIITYNGSATAPAAVGSYAVTGVVNTVMYQGAVSGTLRIMNTLVPVSTNNLISRWKMDGLGGQSNNVVTDFVGSNHGTACGSVSSSTGHIDGAFSFNGLNGMIQVPSAEALKYRGGNMTMSAWIKIGADETDGGYIISKPWNGVGQYNYRLYLNTDKRLILYLMSGGSNEVYAISSTALSVEEWHQIGFTLGDDKTMRIYMDGTEVAAKAHGISNWTPGKGDDNPALAIGCVYPYPSTWAGNSGYSFRGMTDDMRLYNRALSADEMWSIYQAIAPAITTQPADQTVTVGQTATFSVTANGTAPLSYQWRKNGANISGATSASYTTPVAITADNGALFSVVVVNAAGNDVTSRGATLTVKDNQVITFPAIPAQSTTNLVTLTATASSGLPVNFAVASGPARIMSGILSFTGAGSVRVVATQPGNTNWSAATPVTNTIFVSKAAALVTLNNMTQTYDGTPQVATATTVSPNLTVIITYNGSTTPPINAGSYAVTGIVNDVLYQGQAVGTLTVAKKALTVKADAKIMVIGSTVPVLTYTVCGLVNGDTVATVLSGALAATATSTSPAGIYPITQGTLTANANYNLSYTGANLTVPDAGIIGWWKLDETNGTTAADSSGYANNATCVNNPTWVAGKAGKAGNAVLLEAVGDVPSSVKI